jgi:hypothetical protein
MHIKLQSLRRPLPRTGAKLLISLCLCSAIALAGCRREEVAHFRVPKEAQPAERSVTRTASVGAQDGDAPVTAEPNGTDVVKWTLPKGWTQSLTGGIRYATLKPSVPGRVEVTVVVLPGPAGGEIANVNRWRSQIGLPAIDESAMASARNTFASKAGTVSVYDFTSEQAKSRVVAGILLARGNSWFVKMSGDPAVVAAAKPQFLHLLESLRLD